MKKSYSESDLKGAVKKSKSIAEVIRELGLDVSGGNYKTVHRYINEYSIDTSHFSGQRWNKGIKWTNFNARKSLEEILVYPSHFRTSHLKKRLIAEGVKEDRCESCKLTEWMEQKIPLQLHHRNGNNIDNRLLNLMILCPNCHALTPNYAGKNINKTA